MPLLSNAKTMGLSQSPIWDLVIEKAFLTATEADPGKYDLGYIFLNGFLRNKPKHFCSLPPGVDLKPEELNKQRFNLILAEMKELIFRYIGLIHI